VLFKNAKVFDFNTSTFKKSDFLVKSGKILRLNFKLNVESLETVDLGECYVLPGFIDSHIHLISYGRQISTCDLSNFSDLNEMLDFLGKKRDETSTLIARGWNDDLLDEKPRKTKLDDFFPTQPVILVRKCGHLAVVNSASIKEFNLKNINVPYVDLENGIIAESALNCLMRKLEIDEELGVYINRAKENLLSFGITAVHSNDITLEKTEKLIGKLSKISNFRIFNEITVNSVDDVSVVRKENLIRKYTDFFTISSVKSFADGSFGARTAALKKPYIDDPDNIGILLMTDQAFIEILELCKKFGFNVSVHAIGDRAIEQVLRVCKTTDFKGENLRIIHFQIANENIIRTVSELGIRVTIQPIFKFSDQILVEKIFDVERKRNTYPFMELKNNNVLISSSSDAPVELPNPFIGMKILIDNGFSEVDALRTYTLNPAKILGVDEWLGSIEEGKFADFSVYKENPFEKIKNKPEDLTPSLVIVNGRVVLSREYKGGNQ